MRPLVFVGTTNLDIVFYSANLPTVGQSLMGTIEEFGGGKGANQAVAAARLGGAPYFATMFGEDDAADALTKGLADFGVRTDKIRRKPGTASGKSLIFVNSKGSNMIGIDAGANEAFDPDDARAALEDVPQDAVVVVEMGLPAETCRAAFEAKGNRFLIFNPAPVRAPLTEEDCRSIDMITPNETEAQELTGLPVTTVDEAFVAAKALHDSGVAGVAITLGENGVVYLDANHHIHQHAFPVDAVDTTAAGDAFNGALATAIAKGFDIEDALSFAVATASLSVTRKGAQQSMPTEQEVRNFMARQKGRTK
ncbi:ribokinase [Roseovarius sp. 2305UL8-3]|uniref:ribokinase n=1 Tax=Roseovarius conchicola TaxID=3121636 RepID=UPI0035278AFE